jgi:hypothetical protein
MLMIQGISWGTGMSEQIAGFSPAPGEVQVFRNGSLGALVYRIHFVGAGWVEFQVLPGAKFRLLGEQGTINVDIVHYEPPGLHGVDSDPETGGG